MKFLQTGKAKFIFFTIFSFLLLGISFIFALCFGAEKINLIEAFQGNKISHTILFKIRLPRALLAALSGTLLSGSGAIFQLFFRNDLAEPGIMGISSGATLGAVLASSLGLTSSFFIISPINLFAFLGAILSGAIVTLLGTGKTTKESSIMLLLCGTALGTLYSAISSIILLVKSNQLQGIYAWTLGSFNGRGWNELFFILIPAFVSIFLFFFACPQLDLLSSGEQSAKSLGLNVKAARILVLVAGALASSSAVCAGGTISFVGLISPHIVRRILGPKSKILLPFSMIFGAIILLLADTLARTIISPAELPTGVLTAILGVPFFISLCLKIK